jgi:hypothetical protein
MNNSIKVIDDVVSKLYQDHIEEMFSSFYWEFIDGITHQNGVDPNSGFSRTLFNSKKRIELPENKFLLPLLFEGISKYNKGAILKDLYRVRGVLWIKDQNKGSHLPHCDLDTEHHTMVYYINDTDAPTQLYRDGKVFKEVHPKKGRALIFPGDTQHSSASPTKSIRRMILNFNFLI